VQTQQRFKLKVAVHGILQKPSGEVFMIRRFNTDYGDGKFSVPAGHLDGEETVTQGAIREIKEEAGVEVIPADMEMVHVMHRADSDERIDFFFLVKNWQGEPRLAEPDKADQVLWVFPQQLPENTVGYISYFFEQFIKGEKFSEFGWSEI
jgi:ADP-ribose pyrophosphatase YjhB (NUDIX family)